MMHLNAKRSTSNIPPGKVEHLAELVDYADGSVVSRSLGRASGGDLMLFALDAGQEIDDHVDPDDEYVQILEGKARMKIGSHLLDAAEGDIVLMPARTSHMVHAVTELKLLLIREMVHPAFV